MKIEEEWRDIKGYEGLYQVSNKGRVKSLGNGQTHKKEGIRKQNINNNGYLMINLSKEGKCKRFLVHRLVAEAFIPNPNNYSDINHKSEIKTQNNVENLEWCSHQFNSNYGTRNQKISILMSKLMTNNPKKSTPIKCLDLNTNKVIYYPSIHEAARQLNTSHSAIRYSIYKYKSPFKRRYIFSEINK